MKVLVTGGTGLLGKYIKKKKPLWFYPNRKALNITKPDDAYTYLNRKEFTFGDMIFHAAAYTGLKECENQKHLARLTNVCGTKEIAEAAARFKCSLIYISTDYVFDGKKGNYKEEDEVNPLSYYAHMKYEGELEVMQECERSTIIRTSFCNMEWPHPAAFTDKYSSLVTVEKIADALIKIVEDEYRPLGLLHVGGKKKSFYEMAKTLNPDIAKISLDDINIKIPKDSSLDVTRFNRVYGSLE